MDFLHASFWPSGPARQKLLRTDLPTAAAVAQLAEPATAAGATAPMDGKDGAASTSQADAAVAPATCDQSSVQLHATASTAREAGGEAVATTQCSSSSNDTAIGLGSSTEAAATPSAPLSLPSLLDAGSSSSPASSSGLDSGAESAATPSAMPDLESASSSSTWVTSSSQCSSEPCSNVEPAFNLSDLRRGSAELAVDFDKLVVKFYTKLLLVNKVNCCSLMHNEWAAGRFLRQSILVIETGSFNSASL